ncbi:MAG: sulfatase [Acidobacteria bacterium]|nr:sulfatase [Acidobacteriota bacterium]
MRLTRRQFTLGASAAAQPTRKPPSILFIQADDLRFDDMSSIGNTVLKTPNLDRIAAGGVRFENAFVTTAICCCSRACVLTGQNMRRHGIEDFAKPLSAAQMAKTYPVLLRNAGYRTAFLGKFAIGAPNPGILNLSLPKDQFDFWYGFPQSINFKQTVNGKDRHLTPLMTEKAIEFLRSVPSDQPFAMSLNFKEPHGPFNYFDPGRPSRYKDAAIPAPSTHTKEDFEALPEFLRRSLNGNKDGQWPAGAEEKRVADTRIDYHLVAGVDEAVGKIMAVLAELDRDRETVVIFTSDNGSMRGAHGLTGKWIMFEESIRVPLVIRDPRLPASRRGTVRKEMALNIDLAPTILSLAGVPADPGMQGRDLSPLLADRKRPWRSDWYYEHTYNTPPARLPIPRTEGVRGERWKYVRYPGTKPVYEQLFDLAADPVERNNLAEKPEHRSLLSRLRRRCDELRRAAA